jgi:hypothetical protein
MFEISPFPPEPPVVPELFEPDVKAPPPPLPPKPPPEPDPPVAAVVDPI